MLIKYVFIPFNECLLINNNTYTIRIVCVVSLHTWMIRSFLHIPFVAVVLREADN